MFLLSAFFYIFMASVVGTLIFRLGDPPDDAIGVVVIATIFWPLTILLATGIGLGAFVVTKVCDFFEKKPTTTTKEE